MADKADGYVDLTQFQVSFLKKSDKQVGHFTVFKILLQTQFRTSFMVSPSASTNHVGMLSTPADFPFFSALTAALILSRRRPSSGIRGLLSTVGPPSVSQLSTVLCTSVKYFRGIRKALY